MQNASNVASKQCPFKIICSNILRCFVLRVVNMKIKGKETYLKMPIPWRILNTF